MGNILPKDDDYERYLLLLKTRHAIFRAREIELYQYNISPEHVLILGSIAKFGNKATIINISRDVFREFHTIFAQLRIMEKEELVKRVYDFSKKDRFRFLLTDKGKAAYEKSIRRKPIKSIMSVLSEDEQKHLDSCLGKLLEAALKELELNHFEYKANSRKRTRKKKETQP